MMLNIFSGTYLRYTHLLWWCLFQSFCPLFYSVVCLIIYSKYKSSITYMFCRYFLTVWWLIFSSSSSFSNSILWKAKFSVLIKSTFFFYSLCFCTVSKISLPNLRSLVASEDRGKGLWSRNQVFSRSWRQENSLSLRKTALPNLDFIPVRPTSEIYRTLKIINFWCFKPQSLW